MKRLLAFALALTIPAAFAAAQQSALQQAGAETGTKTGAIAEEIAGLYRNLAPGADENHLFTIIKDARAKATFIEIRQQQLERPYLLSATLNRGTGEGLLTATSLGTFLIVFHWNGEKIEVTRKSMTFEAAPGTPEAKALAESGTESILAELPMVSSDSAKHVLRFPAENLFLSDLCNLMGIMQKTEIYAGSSINRSDSSIKELAAYAKNAEAEVRIVFNRPGNTEASMMPDPRNYSIDLHYSLSEVPGDPDYQQRFADGRVGYFTQTHVNYGNKNLQERGLPIETIIQRWNLRKTDPSAAVSDVENPIVYWLDDTIPTDYRPAIKAGILAWNEAFEAIGLRNAIQVKEVDKDMTPEQRASFNPADASYNVVRWFMANGMAFAEASSRANPTTGQIFNADIRICDGIVRALTEQQLAETTSVPGKSGAGAEGPVDLASDFTERAQLELSKGLAMLDARGAASAEKMRFVREFLTWTAAHETGHTLGLRHNFKGSEWLTEEQLGKNGMLTASIMDYLPPNMAAKDNPSMPYFQTKVGPYDKWAIEYGYGSDPAKVAARASSDSSLAYAPDEEIQTVWGAALDPDAQIWDIGKGAMVNARRHIRQAQEIWKSLSTAVQQPRENGSVSLRRKYVVGLEEYRAAAATLAPVIGGIRVSRGDPGAGNDSYQPVPADEQRAALAFFKENVFSDKPFTFDPAVLRKLGDEGTGQAGVFNGPVTASAEIARLRDETLMRLYAPATLSRLANRDELTDVKSDRLSVYDVMGELRRSIWQEIEGRARPISAGRRRLQDQQLDILVRIWQTESGDVKGAALRDIKHIQSDARRALAANGLDTPTRMHLENDLRRIDDTLRPQFATQQIAPQKIVARRPPLTE